VTTCAALVDRTKAEEQRHSQGICAVVVVEKVHIELKLRDSKYFRVNEVILLDPERINLRRDTGRNGPN
jgi:hypothetical protein